MLQMHANCCLVSCKPLKIMQATNADCCITLMLQQHAACHKYIFYGTTKISTGVRMLRSLWRKFGL
jgi:hypothetical protein